MHIMDGDGISKIEIKQDPASVYVMSENNLLRYPKEGGAASPQDTVWQIVNPGMMGPATYRITVNSQAAAHDLDTNTLVLIVTDTKNKTQELVITFTKKN